MTLALGQKTPPAWSLLVSVDKQMNMSKRDEQEEAKDKWRKMRRGKVESGLWVGLFGGG